MDSLSAILGEKPRASIISYELRRHTHLGKRYECDHLLIKSTDGKSRNVLEKHVSQISLVIMER